MPRPSRLPAEYLAEPYVLPTTQDPGLERLCSGLLTVVRDARENTLNLRQLAVLSLIVSTAGPHSIGELAATLQLKGSTTTRVVDRLEFLKLAKRLPDPDDRRSVLVCATRPGRALAKKIGSALAPPPS